MSKNHAFWKYGLISRTLPVNCAALMIVLIASSLSAQPVTVQPVSLGVGGYLAGVWPSPDGSRILMRIGDDADGTYVIWNIGAGERPFADKAFGDGVLYYSPDYRYAVVASNAYGSGNPVKDAQGTKRDMKVVLRMDTARTRDVLRGTNYYVHETFTQMAAYADGYILGVTNRGWLITTDASKRAKNARVINEYDHYDGLRICHPQFRDSVITITEDAVKRDGGGGFAKTVVSQDGTTVYTYGSAFTDDFSTVKCWPLKAGAKARSFRARMKFINPSWWSDTRAVLTNPAANYFETYDTETGRLLAADSNLTSSGRPLTLWHDRIFRYDGHSFTMETLEPKDGHLVPVAFSRLDTAGLQLSQHMPYYARLLNDEKWLLLPTGMGQGGAEQLADIRSGKGNRAIAVSVKTGKPLAIYAGLFSGGRTQTISEGERLRAEAVKKDMAWGTAAGRKDDGSSTPEFFIAGEYIGKHMGSFNDRRFSIYDKWYYVLSTNFTDRTYNLLYMDGKNTAVWSHAAAGDMLRGSPPFVICDKCFGRGRRIETEITEAWSAWVDANGHVTYTREERYDKHQDVDKVCRYCNGAGWHQVE